MLIIQGLLLVRTTVIWRLAWTGGEFGCKLIHRTDGKTPQFQTGYWSKASATQYVGSSTGLFTTDRTSRDRVTQSQDSTAASLDLTSEVTRSHQPCAECGEGLHKVTPPGGRASGVRSWRLESFLLINLL